MKKKSETLVLPITPVFVMMKGVKDEELTDWDRFINNRLLKAEKLRKRIRDTDNRNLGYIYTVKEVAEKLQFSTDTIYNMIDEDQSKDILKREFDLWEEGNHYLFEKNSLYKFISKNSYKYVNGKKLPCKYSRLPEYYTINDCAKMKGLENGRQFRRNYIDNNPARLEGVEILKIGRSTVRIEKASFELWIKSEGEKAT